MGNAAIYFYIFIVTIIGLRGSYLVSLSLLLDYFWASFIILGPLLIIEFTTFMATRDIYSSMQHVWTENSLRTVRYFCCSPRSSYNSYCNTPFFSNVYEQAFNVTEYCLAEYQSATLCEETRDNAINCVVDKSIISYTCILSVGLACIVLLLYGIYISYSVITLKIFTQSMNDRISYLLLISSSFLPPKHLQILSLRNEVTGCTDQLFLKEFTRI